MSPRVAKRAVMSRHNSHGSGAPRSGLFERTGALNLVMDIVSRSPTRLPGTPLRNKLTGQGLEWPSRQCELCGGDGFLTSTKSKYSRLRATSVVAVHASIAVTDLFPTKMGRGGQNNMVPGGKWRLRRPVGALPPLYRPALRHAANAVGTRGAVTVRSCAHKVRALAPHSCTVTPPVELAAENVTQWLPPGGWLPLTAAQIPNAAPATSTAEQRTAKPLRSRGTNGSSWR
jgi:hypothetical protein